MPPLPLPHSVPNAIFLAGGPQPMRTEVAHRLADLIPGGQAHSFAAPIRDGVVGTFFMGDPSIDIAALANHPILPSLDSPTFGGFVTAFSQFMAAFFSDPAIIGKIAARRIEENMTYFHHFIFDDADTKENIRIIADLIGRDKSMIVNFAPNGLMSRTIRVIDIRPDTPRDAVCEIFAALAPVPLPVPPASPTPLPASNQGIDLNDLA